MWIRLTSGGPGGRYGWEAVRPGAGGGWERDPGEGHGTEADDPAIEANGNDAIDVSGRPVVRAMRERGSGYLVFQIAGSC